jgi:hypothetical protein
MLTERLRLKRLIPLRFICKGTKYFVTNSYCVLCTDIFVYGAVKSLCVKSSPKDLVALSFVHNLMLRVLLNISRLS